MMHRTQILPAVLIAIDLGAALVYAFDWNVRLTLYWVSAAVLTACVTF